MSLGVCALAKLPLKISSLNKVHCEFDTLGKKNYNLSSIQYNIETTWPYRRQSEWLYFTPDAQVL